MGECSAYSRAEVESKVKFAAWPTSWWPPGADRLSHRGLELNSHIQHTINIVLCIVITYCQTGLWI